MKTKIKNFAAFLLIIGCLSFCSCGKNETANPKLAVLSLSTASLGTYDGKSSSSVNQNSNITVTVGLKTESAINMCGYQCVIKYDATKFKQVSPVQYSNRLEGFNVTVGNDTQSSGYVRIVAVPQTGKGYYKAISANTTVPFVQVVFKAIGESGSSGQFSVVSLNDFTSSISKYDGSGNPMFLNKVDLGNAVSIKIN